MKYGNENTNQFIYEHFITLNDMDFIGNVFFSNHLIWFSYGREKMLFEYVDLSKCYSGEIVLVIKNTAIAYLKSYSLHDIAQLAITVGEATPTTMMVYARFFNKKTTTLFAVAKQLILFTNQQGKPCPFPASFNILLEKFPEVNCNEVDKILMRRMFKDN